jgi:tRNA(Ile)-lysidine synthase
VAAEAARQHLNLEDAARRLRYAFFHSIVEQGQATKVAVAHTADDQAETLLARLFRGTGPAGLAGIQPVRGAIIRPLLAARREELREYLRSVGQPWREDVTNLDVSRQRARIRAQLLPVLERDFSPAIVRHLGELARLSRGEGEFWSALVDGRFRALAREEKGRLTIPVADLLSPLEVLSGGSVRAVRTPASAMRALTERLVRRLYEEVRGDCHDLSAVHVDQVIHLAAEGVSGSRVQLPGGVVAERDFGKLIFSRACSKRHARRSPETAEAHFAYQYVTGIPREGVAAISVPELGTRFLLKVVDWSCMERDTRREDTLDADLLKSTLTLRNWKPGDAYRPRGHRQARKLKQLFLAHRVSRGERIRWPVIECAGSIIWVRDMPLPGDFCAGHDTKRGLRIEEERL